MREIKKWIELILSLIFTALGEFMAWLQLEWLQKIYYMLAAILMLVAIWKLLRNKNLSIEKLSQPGSIVEQAHNPKKKGEFIVKVGYKMINALNKSIKKGGQVMKNFLKSRGWLQWVSLLLTLILLVIGILSAFVPELAVVGENIEAYLVALGLVVAPGILAKGNDIGESVKSVIPSKERKAIEKSIKQWAKKLADLTEQYKDIILLAQDVAELGGELTPEQQIRYNTYATQKKAIEAKIDAERKKLEVPKDV